MTERLGAEVVPVVRPIVVDVHTHLIPPGVLDPIREGRFDGLAVDDSGAVPMLVVRGRRISPASARHSDLVSRPSVMDEMGVDVQAVSLVPPLVGYHLPKEQAIDFCHLVNDSIVKAIAVRPDRFVGLANVPLQEPTEAARELRRAVVDLGLKGVQIGANVGGTDLGEERFFPFWQAVSDLDCFVFVHPNQGSLPAVERMGRFHLHNLIGNPLDTSLAIASLIFRGHLERWPNLKVCFAHAGGFVPYQIGRFDHAYRARQDVGKAIPRLPSEYFSRFYFDTISHGTDALRFLASQVGPSQLLLGTDYPADMADGDPVKSVAGLGLGEAEQRAVLGGSAARMLGLGAGARR